MEEDTIEKNIMGKLSNWLARLTVNQVPMDLGVRIPLYPPLTTDISIDRLPDLVSGGCRFESCLVDHEI